jgi:hypothetical protein
MSTLEYCRVIKIVSSTPNHIYDGYFFVERLYDDQLVLISDKTISLGITEQELDDKTIERIIIVYKPKYGHDFVYQNKMFVGQMIEIEFEDTTVKDSKIIGKIINTKDQIIEVETKEGILYIPVNRGLPKQIISIKTINKEEKQKGPEVKNAKDELDDFLEDGILDVFEEEVEENSYYY